MEMNNSVEKRMHKYPIKGLLSNKIVCQICKENHFIQNCETFLKLNSADRMRSVVKNKLCTNCLRSGHYSKQCKSSFCKICQAKHNTLLHEDKQISNPESSITLSNTSLEKVLLSTVIIQVEDRHGKLHKVKALLDSGSQSSFITKELSDQLKLQSEKINLAVAGLSQSISKIEQKCHLNVKSLTSGFTTNVTCFVLNQITGYLPTTEINRSSLNIPPNIKLADPHFYKPSKIDMLIGAELFWSLLCVGQINLGKNKPVLQKTRLGWIISGPLGSSDPHSVVCNFSQNVQDQLARFWEIEEVGNTRALSLKEKDCEHHFVQNTTRNEDGRFMIRIPLKGDISKLGESKQQALRRFLLLERRFQSNPLLKERYTQFMIEYENLNHMTKVNENRNSIGVYLPHHGVLKEESTSTKLRTVFDGSAPTSTGISLNDLQMVGPTIQDNLMSIILRFRQHAYVITADICKMYRQVLVAPSDRSLQRILWRKNPSDPIHTYQLNTVTYGTSSAPFLAIRCLFQLAIDCEKTFPDIANIIKDDFYVDDLITGADSIERLVYICENITKVLEGGGFELCKWHSNEPKIFQNSTLKGVENYTHDFGADQNTKTLGLRWSCQADSLIYIIPNSFQMSKITKRTILSCISQIFDPLGLLSPVTIKVKMLLQKIWLEKLSWDESLPSSLNTTWAKFRNELPILNHLQIPRHVMCRNPRYLELHAFSDASEFAYGACVYVRSVNSQNESVVYLLCSKSKVAPLKPLTVPRLELCGALVSSRLVKRVQDSLSVKFNEITFWKDSTIVLGWLSTPPNALKPFVSNRVSEIQDITKLGKWRHVPTDSNPADLVSRGLDPSKLRACLLWWHGPDWLSKDHCLWPESKYAKPLLPEIRSDIINNLVVNTTWFPIHESSNLLKLKHVMAYSLRFIHNCRNPNNRLSGPLEVSEIQGAFNVLIKLAQGSYFPGEMKSLLEGKCIDSKSKITSLSPFLDRNRIMRVGGRIENSEFPYAKQHPVILPPTHHLTKLILEHEHKRLLHAGPQQLLASVREEFWPVSGRNLSKQIVRNCIKCFKHNPKSVQPIMGQLPKTRLQLSFPFNVTGVDYAGPFQLRDRKGRGSKVTKAWICLFVCFSTKAVHLELVSDLSTQTFMLALKRFVARRGKPQDIYSDNGTTFKGAANELKYLKEFFQNNQDTIIQTLADEDISWHFIPPHAPHFGGIWEAGVRCAKYHLKRILNNSSITYEEFYSLAVQIESILNSRPLFPLSDHPDDLIPLSPAHFLIGRTSTAVPEADLSDIPINRLDRYQYLQQLKAHFWKRWYKEFISQLQQRNKWRQHQGFLQEGDLVILKEDNLPVQKWVLGRVSALHPGQDGVARVATVKTAQGPIKRPVNKLCPLPKDEDFERKTFQRGGHVKNHDPMHNDNEQADTREVRGSSSAR